MSATQSRFAASARKSRWTRSGRRVASGSGRRGAPRLPAPFRTDDSAGSHQPLHPATAALLAGAAQRQPHPPVAVGVVVGRVQLVDSAEQPLVVDRTCRAATARPLGSKRTPARPRPDRSARPRSGRGAHRRSGAHLDRSGSSSRAKNNDAERRISFARRSSASSFRNRRISSRSWLVNSHCGCRYRPPPAAHASAASPGGCPDPLLCARATSSLASSHPPTAPRPVSSPQRLRAPFRRPRGRQVRPSESALRCPRTRWRSNCRREPRSVATERPPRGR